MRVNNARITRTKKLLDINNCWQANTYYLVYCRVYSDDNNYYYPLKYIVCVDWTDMPEDTTENDYLNDCFWAILGTFDYYNIAAAVSYCNETITAYNM